ncbi:N-acetylglucosaminyldiphosphoundecaprenol N-acetyl-beta-D-mannosaminyltransferase [Halopseudomonas sabulinigri]|uniref:N-acetylglucosaminyldiphosphoundecaprenol N-acetyl-beta-D-mannosaminyltransferase n=1 Tax=Halopseudomonas sabulinigri TaxID=472181 RepID=A0A1H1L8U4_9GAMM|nr:WecB/TagA/CpsF family glycosyltransferase [Halopseudomonas sabulinigri]SDR70712.1 N-acetylglucosaminyldiphosphoundecaprenol N-acetyl-beta-D-mannosaminyltransferase [Halopseudomonas sabulinigri]
MNVIDNKNHTFVNPYSYSILRKQRPGYLTKNCFQLHYDGIALVCLSNALGLPSKRSSFDDTSLAPTVFSECQRHQLSVGLVGSAPGIAEEASQLLQQRYPSLIVQLVSDGFLSGQTEVDVKEKALECDVIVCSMGTPRQEDFLYELRLQNWEGTGFTCGGFLDQLVSAGGKDYYPTWVDRYNLRWLYRIAKEPRRLLFRYAVDYPVGMTLFIFDFFFTRERKHTDA